LLRSTYFETVTNEKDK